MLRRRLKAGGGFTSREHHGNKPPLRLVNIKCIHRELIFPKGEGCWPQTRPGCHEVDEAAPIAVTRRPSWYQLPSTR